LLINVVQIQAKNKRSVTVTIYVNGKKFGTATSSGAYVIASTDKVIEYNSIEE
jgi:hypothetical protein